MFSLYYNKQKNDILFGKSIDIVNIEDVQNYIPLYNKYFSEKSYNETWKEILNQIKK